MVEFLDRRFRRYQSPVRIVAACGAVNPAVLLARAGLQPSTQARTGTCLPPGGTLLLDYGCEYFGGVRLITGYTGSDFQHEAPYRIRLTLGESVSEALGTPDNQHAIHDFTGVALPPMGRAEFGQSAFRFVRLENLESERSFELLEASLAATGLDLEHRGRFESDDPRLNDIWRAAGRTVHLCMQEKLWDGAKRDQLVWMGDMHPELMAIAAIFGKVPVVEQSMDCVRDETPLPEFMNRMPGYSLCWVLCQYDWFRHYGDREYLEKQRSYLNGLLDLFCRKVEDHEARFIEHNTFIDWAHAEEYDMTAGGFHALMVRGLAAGRELALILDESALSGRLERALARLRHWPVNCGAAKSVCAARVLAGLEEPGAANANKLSREPLRGMSPFHGLNLLEARALAGDEPGCLALVRDYWGAMLDLGSTTFWEHFDVDWIHDGGRIDELPDPRLHDIHREYGRCCFRGWRNSLCHGWGAGVAAFMSRYILGFNIMEPGCRRMAIVPHLGHLREVAGSLPTPYGDIRVRHARRPDGSVATEIDAPGEIAGTAFSAR